MMYFSRVKIAPSAIAKSRLLDLAHENIYAAHQLVWKLFPGEPKASRMFLYRQETEKEQMYSSNIPRILPLFYIVSESAPRSMEGFLNVETKLYDPHLAQDEYLNFSLRANPIVARKKEGKENSVKHDVLMDAKMKARKAGITKPNVIEERMNKAVIQWLIGKGERAGFSIENSDGVEVSAYNQHCLYKRGGEKIQFSSVDLTGVLRVTDVDAFRTMLFNGVGHSRSFGCGLLMVRRM
jgi:CRISPR system Cascade subunit CasE